MLTLLWLAACNYESMAPSWLIDRTRILGVQAEVFGVPGLAEPRPGDLVTFQSLVVHPDYEVFGVTWMGCLPDDASSFGCEVDMEAIEALFEVDTEELTPQELQALFAEAQEAGFLGFEPYFPPFLTVPDDVLDSLTEEERLEGQNYFLTLTAFPYETEEGDTGEFIEVDLEGDDQLTEIAYKRMPVSEAITPNHNPEMVTLQVDGHPLEEGQVLHLTAGQQYDLEPILGENAIEEYRYVTSEGVEETRTEEPYFTFYATGGDFDVDYALYPHSSVTWTAPEDPAGTSHRLWAVTRDRRGGMSWWTINAVLEDGS